MGTGTLASKMNRSKMSVAESAIGPPESNLQSRLYERGLWKSRIA
jgi:hypothetical protein